ncbi:MAG: hypothetical protein WDO16_09325 [Bacteroidota bacterium]
MHPAGTVIDEKNGVQHVFFYSGNRCHGEDGAPDKGYTGIFRLSRTLDTKKWVRQSRQLENYNEIYHLNEDFNTLDNWGKSGSPTGIMVLPRTEPAFRKPVDLPHGDLKVKEGNLYLKTGEPGYYGLHNEHTITSINFKMEFKARIKKFPEAGYPLGVHINVGAEKMICFSEKMEYMN